MGASSEAAAALDGFGHVGRADGRGFAHVRDCTRDFQDPMVAAGRQAEPLDGALQQFAAGRVGKFMGQTGINVMTRLMGLILAAIAVEVMSDGLLKLFPALAR